MKKGGFTRRGSLQLAGAAAAYSLMKPFAWAAGKTGLHGLSVFGELKYPADFTYFDYLNPNAPKGGRMNFQPPNWILNQNTQTFNTLNSFVLRGDAPPRMEITFDTLMVRATDEPDAIYGLVAETVDVSEDANLFTFHLRSEARFHDGTPLTAEDVAFSFMLLKEKGHPVIAQPIREMVSADAIDDRTLTVTLSGKQTRDTIFSIADLPIFSKAYYTANDFTISTLDPPLASGPYRVGRVNAGKTIEYERVPDYWGASLPVNVGQYNFDVIRIDFFQERETAFQAFTKGTITYRQEFTAKTWALEYNFPALTQGRVKRSEDFPIERRPSMYGWFINARRAKFADPRTRLAIALAFDFEWTNRTIFFDSYTRQSSYYQHSDFTAQGLPNPDELALLEPFRDQLPEEVFGEAWVPPTTDGSGRDRVMQRQALDLLQQAGWTLDGRRLVDESGTPLTVEFLIDVQSLERPTAPYVENLKRIGVDAAIRQVDPVQSQARETDFDFDIILFASTSSATPIDSQHQAFTSEAADTPGSYNFSGIKDPVVDALIEKLPEVTSRDQLVAILRAIDRVLRAGHYWVPGWYAANHRVAYWDIFAWPEKKPDYAFQPELTWWFDDDKAKAIGYSA